MQRTPAATRALFDAWAATYDRDLLAAHGPLLGYRESLERATAALPVVDGMRVLDIGIGTGAFSAPLAARGARIVGLDPSLAMLARCRASHPANALAVGGFGPLPFVSATIELVVASFAFHEVPAPERPMALAELRRVLRPGGRCCLLDIMFASAAAVADACRSSGPAWDDTEEYPLVGDLDTLLRASGFAAPRWGQTGPFHWLVIAECPATGA